MSVMSVGKKPRALVHPLRAGNSRPACEGASSARVSPARRRPARKSERVPGVSRAAQPGTAAPARPRGTGKPPARPRLWVVPDPPGPAGGRWSPARVAPGARSGPPPARSRGRPLPPAAAVAPRPGRPSGVRAARPRGRPRVRAAGPASAPSGCPPGGCGGPGSPGAGAGWSGPSRFSSSWPCSPRSCSPWRPGPRRPTTACRRLRSGRPAARRGQARASRCGRSR